MELLLNQVGFGLAGGAPSGAPKFVLAQSQDDLGGQCGRVHVADARGMVRYEADLEYLGRMEQWNRCYWRADLSGFEREGEYEVRATVGASEARAGPVIIGSGRVARTTLSAAAGFFYYQRCGVEVPGWHAPCHMDDTRLPDGSHIDAVGGWHDAGDYNKYNGYTPLAVFALARASRHDALRSPEARSRDDSAATLPAPADEAAWGAAWIAKMQDQTTGLIRGDVFAGYSWWGPPEDETDNRPGNDDDRPVRGEPSLDHQPGMAMLAFAALAALRPDEPRWLRCAQRLDRAIAGRALPLTQQAAAALAYLNWPQSSPARHEQARRLAAAVLEQQRADGSFHDSLIVDQGFVPAALAEIALHARGDPPAADIAAALLRYLEFSLARSRNPFRLMQWSAQSMFYPYPEPKAWYVGQNSMYLSQAWALLLTAKVLERSSDAVAQASAALACELAWAQLDWVLGCNPFGLCMLEGAGWLNPPRYHHRYDSIPGRERGAVPGAICNGIVRETPERDAPRFDLEGNDYHSNEPWLPHNAYYLLAVSEL